jgi:hypothetical protein
MIKVSSGCPSEDAEACKYSWSRISALEIVPLEAPKEAPT